jgi:hypothetical protein
MATFLFVHGAFQGGWVWGKVADILRQGGHGVHTPTLSGCAAILPTENSRDMACLTIYLASLNMLYLRNFTGSFLWGIVAERWHPGYVDALKLVIFGG